jgi:hypothetical protein
MNVKLQASGSPFAHTISSCLNIEPKNHIWVNEEDPEAEAIVFMDYDHRGGFDYTGDKKKILWISESRSITRTQHFDLYDNTEEFLSVYDLVLTHCRDIIKKDKRIMYAPNAANLPWVEEPQIYEKTRMTSMLCSGKAQCTGHLVRNSWANELKNHLDLFGRNIRPVKKVEEALCPYMFSVVIENESYPTYFTEKIMNCFATGTVPVYYGSPDISDYFNIDGIILLDSVGQVCKLTEDDYHSRRDAIADNLDRCINHPMADDVVYNEIKERLLCQSA